MRKTAANRGVVMVMVLSILLMMGMLCTVFTTHARLHKHVAGSFTDDVRAKLAAQSGLEYAVERLRNDMDSGALFSPGAVRPGTYWGDVDTEQGAAHPWVPLVEATNPSYAVDALSVGDPTYDPYATYDPSPKLVPIDGALRGVSMTMETGTYAHNGDTATLRVLGTQGMININDGVGEDGFAYRPVTMNLRRILDALGAAAGVSGLAAKLIDARPPGGWSTKRQVSAQFTPAEWKKLSALIATASWTDKDVAMPVPLSTDVLSSYPGYYHPAPTGHLWRGSPALLRRGRHKDFHGDAVTVPLMFAPPAAHTSGSVRVYGMDELSPTWIQIAERSPVSVNEAPREVLIALLDGLQGFFMLEPRRRWPNTQCGQQITAMGVYWWSWSPPDLSPAPMVFPINPNGGGGSLTADIPDEIGRLFSTVKIAAGASTGASISAETIADEIIACRTGTASANVDYSNAWFGGPFATWRQFHAFCDNLAAVGVLVDNRDLYRDVNPATANPYGEGPTIASTIQKQYAAQAIADALKANFNPNLHLNETNPDRNLFTFVDKTDLIVNSTEFALSPSGTYEIESLGRVLRPLDGEDAFSAADNQLMGRHTVYATARLFDMRRETSQKHFYDGTPAPLGAASPETNNRRSLEVGPEPDNGPAASQNEWGGYLALPTIGGHGTEKAPQTLASTPVGTNADGLGSKAHGHFSWDDRLHYHVDGGPYCQDLSNHALEGEHVENFAAPGETLEGPYMPAHGTGSPYRLARSFRIDGASVPSLPKAAPGNLRVDGLYAERHSGPSWWLSKQLLPEYITENSLGEKFVRINGVVSYWIKPTYFPEMSGKTRVYFDASNSAMPFTPHHFLHCFAAAHDSAAFQSSTDEDTLRPDYLSHIPPVCFMFGNNYNGVASDSLNHVAHADSTVHSPVQGHRWVHVVLAFWDDPAPETHPQTIFDVYVNGVKVGRYDDRPLAHGSLGYDHPPKHTGWSERADGSQNAFRFGSVSKLQNDTNLRWISNDPNTTDTGSFPIQFTRDRGNYALAYGADSTIDEFFLWGESSDDPVADRVQQALSLWQQGRYLVPGDGEGAFLSKEIVLGAASARALAPATSAAPPVPTGEGGGGGGGGSSVPAYATTPSVRVLGLSWTLYGEGVDAAGEPILLDHQSASLPTIQVDTALTLHSGGSALSPTVFADGYSPVEALAGGPLVLSPGQPIQYEARFLLAGADLNTILVATPVIDDVTIYYTAGVSLDQIWMD